jgi:hypothetical protein
VAGTAAKVAWDWNGSTSAPTLTPSILKHTPGKRCHSFVRNGVVEFLADCEHELAGQSVKMLQDHARPFE